VYASKQTADGRMRSPRPRPPKPLRVIGRPSPLAQAGISMSMARECRFRGATRTVRVYPLRDGGPHRSE
jgi:hypothetical protein